MPNNILLVETAVAWVKSFAGDDAIVSARMHLDEQGCGWVDVYFAPIRQQKNKGRLEIKAVISVNKCHEEHALSHGYSKSSHYTALVDPAGQSQKVHRKGAPAASVV